MKIHYGVLSTLCGVTAHSVSTTRVFENVTCLKCLEKLAKNVLDDYARVDKWASIILKNPCVKECKNHEELLRRKR